VGELSSRQESRQGALVDHRPGRRAAQAGGWGAPNQPDRAVRIRGLLLAPWERTVFLVLGPVVALHRLSGASGWGFISSGMTAGTLISACIAMWYKARRPIAFGMAACMLTALPMLALAARLPLYLVVVSSVVGMLGVLVLNTNWDTAIQQVIPNELLSRFRSYDYLLAFVAIPVGYAIAGPLQSAFGADTILYAASALAVAANAIPAILPMVRAVVRHPDGTITAPSKGLLQDHEPV
jgi:hypothetical protein